MLFSHVREDGSAEFHYPGRDHDSVRVTGSFCAWSLPGSEMVRTDRGFSCEVGPVPPGETAYKFIVDGRWLVDPQNLAREPDGAGGENAVLCRGDARGAVHHLRFHAPALGQERAYVLYLPPSYAESGRRFPTLYLLHGALDWERSWLEKGDLAATMDRLRGEREIGDMIVVMPNDGGDLYRGDARFVDYLARDLVGHVDHELRTLADPRHRALDGLSTGGYTSLVVGAARPDVFGSIGSMSGCHDERTFDAIRARAEAMRASGQRHRVSCGRDEPHVETNRAVGGALRGEAISVDYVETPGTHDWPLWREALPGHLCFHWDNAIAR